MATRYSETARVTMSQKRLNSLEKEVSQVHNETQQLHSEIIPPKQTPGPVHPSAHKHATVCNVLNCAMHVGTSYTMCSFRVQVDGQDSRNLLMYDALRP